MATSSSSSQSSSSSSGDIQPTVGQIDKFEEEIDEILGVGQDYMDGEVRVTRARFKDLFDATQELKREKARQNNPRFKTADLRGNF